MKPYRETPEESERTPPGIPFIIGNEAAERFSFYGMRAILVAFMVHHLVDAEGVLDTMEEHEAKGWFHVFMGTSYLTPVLGAFLADRYLGKYRTILGLSLVYCLGHLSLALDDTRAGLVLGLGLIALGSGGIKPCVSAHVGDQFGHRNQARLGRVFGWFYVAINVGAAVSILATPILLRDHGSHVAFGLPGVLMAIATLLFFAGRHRFVHVPPGGREFTREIFSREGLRTLSSVAFISWIFIAMFWALFDQMSSAWVIQGERMNRVVLGISVESSQMQFVNPALILVLVPLFSRVVYPMFRGGTGPSLIVRLAVGLLVAPFAFVMSAYLEHLLDDGVALSIAWLVIPYVLITSAEVLISPTALELFYRQAPNRMKSAVMAVYFIGVALGNYFAAGVNHLLTDSTGKPLFTGPAYFLFFAACMGAVALAFLPYARRFVEHVFVQGDEAIVSDRAREAQ
jgi:proton-dependent oligopeptide transporter, POT family